MLRNEDLVDWVSPMKKIAFISAMMLAASAAIPVASAATGMVVVNQTSCDYFIVETKLGYALLEWYGGHEADTGDFIVGSFEQYGMKDVYDTTADSSIHVWVEDFWMDKEDVVEKYRDHCS